PAQGGAGGGPAQLAGRRGRAVLEFDADGVAGQRTFRADGPSPRPARADSIRRRLSSATDADVGAPCIVDTPRSGGGTGRLADGPGVRRQVTAVLRETIP